MAIDSPPPSGPARSACLCQQLGALRSPAGQRARGRERRGALGCRSSTSRGVGVQTRHLDL
eukprot:5186728-Alexandrium_andersonii.AAC.1